MSGEAPKFYEGEGNLGAQGQFYNNPIDFGLEASSKGLHSAYNQAVIDGDRRGAQSIREQQGMNARMSQATVEFLGLDPSMRSPIDAWPNEEIEFDRQMRVQSMRDRAFQGVLEQNGWAESEAFLNGAVESYRQQNKILESVDTSGMGPDELFELQRNLRPVVMDPSVIANERGKLAKIDAELKQILGPKASVFTDPRTARVANWINREYGTGPEAILASGQDPMNLGAAGEVADVLHGGVEAFADPFFSFLWGSMKLLGLPTPTNYVEGPNGEILTNEAKAFGLTEAMISLGATLFGEDVQRTIASYGSAKQEQALQLDTWQNVTRGVVMGVGGLAGYTQVGGRLMAEGTKAIGTYGKKGFEWLAKATPHGEKIGTILKTVGGAAVGEGLNQAVSEGDAKGYLKAFTAGAVMGPVFVGLGALGKGAERYLNQRVKIPRRANQALAGAFEAHGFLAWNQVQSTMLWEFMRHPSESTWQEYVSTVLSFAILKGAGGRTPGQHAMERGAEMAADLRRGLREDLAREISEFERGKAGPEAPAAEPEPVPRGTEESKPPAAPPAPASADRRIRRAEALHALPPEQQISHLFDAVSRDPRKWTVEDLDSYEAGVEQLKKLFHAPHLSDAQRDNIAILVVDLAKAREHAYHAWDKENVREPDAPFSLTSEQQSFIADWMKRHPLQDLGIKDLSLETTRMVEHVEGREPTIEDPRQAKEQIPGVLPGAETQLELGAFGIGEGTSISPERVKTEDVLAKRTKRAEDQGRDPLEDPGFMERPPEQRKAILERRTAKERRQTASSFEGPERRVSERRKPIETMLGEARELWRRRIEKELPERRKKLVEQIQAEDVSAAERRQAELRELADRFGVPYDMFRELGEAMAEGDWRRARSIQRDMDVAEGLSDPILNQELRDTLEREALEAREQGEPGERPEPETLETGRYEPREPDFIGPKAPPRTSYEVHPSYVDPDFGERYGPESMRAVANPYRQQKQLTEDEVMLSEIASILQGRRPKEGFRIPFTAKRVRPRAGSPVQLVNREGYIANRSTLGVFNVFENITRTSEGLDLVVMAHEWSHGMQRQVQIGASGRDYWKGVHDWMKTLDADVLADMRKILEFYPGIEKMKPRMRVGAEAWAEWFARDLLGDPTLYESYPALSKHMLEWLNAPEQRVLRDGQYRDAKAAIRTWRDMGSKKRVSAGIRRREPKSYDPQPIEELETKFKSAWVDDRIHLKKAQERAFKHAGRDPRSIDVMNDPARIIDIIAMNAHNRAHAIMSRGPQDWAGRSLMQGKGWFETIRDVAEGYKGKQREERILDFYNYIYSTVARSRIEKDEHQMQVPISDFVKASQDILDSNPDFIGKAQQVKAFTDNLVDLLGQAGGLTEAEIQWMKDKHVLYLPLFRVMETEGWQTRFGSIGQRATALKRTKGGSRAEIMDPADAMFDVARQVVVKANTQMVLKSLYMQALSEDVGELVTLIPRSKVPNEFRVDQVVAALRKAILDKAPENRTEWETALGDFADLMKEEGLTDAIVTLFSQKSMPTGEHAAIMFYTPRLSEAEINALPSRQKRLAREHNGKMVWMEVNQQAYGNLMALDRPLTAWSPENWLMRNLARPTAKMLKTFATDANPVFSAANVMRDTGSGAVYSPEGKIDPAIGLRETIIGAAAQIRYGSAPWIRKAFKSIFREDEFKSEIVDMLYNTGTRSVSIHDEGMRREMRGEAQGIVNKGRKALDTWINVVSSPESWIRTGASIKTARREMEKLGLEATAENWRALPLHEALRISLLTQETYKERSINFARAGDVARSYNLMTPYFTASIAAMRKTIRALLGSEGKTDEERARFQRAAWANGIVSITLPSLVAWWLVKDEDWYKDLPQWRKENFLNFKLPDTDTIVSLPLPFELGVIFGAVPMHFFDRMTDGNPAELLPMLGRAMVPYASNLTGLIPTFIKGPLEITTGYDFFRQQELTPYWMEQSRPPREQMRESTSFAAQWLFDHGFNYVTDNPIETEHLLGSYTAGASTTLLRSIDEIAGLKDHPGLSNYAPGLSQFFNRFTRQSPHGPSRTVDDLYEEGRRIEQIPAADRTPQESWRLTQINQAKQELARIRKAMDLGHMQRVEGDRRRFEIANRIMQKVR